MSFRIHAVVPDEADEPAIHAVVPEEAVEPAIHAVMHLHRPGRKESTMQKTLRSLKTVRAHVVSKGVVWWHTLIGVLYVAATLFGSSRFLAKSQAILANDFFWAEFNATIGGVYAANAFNSVLFGVASATTMALTDPSFAILDTLPLSATAVEFNANYGRLVQFHRLTAIEHGIVGMRRTPAAQAPTVFTQYCWVDFDKRWSLAHTAKRAERCLQEHMRTNGAVYMESMLRNVKWDVFISTWEDRFMSGIANAVLESPDGAAFLQDAQRNALVPLEQEAAYWRSKGITHYQLQCQPAWQLGLDEKVEIVNALGIRSLFTIKKMPFSSADRTFGKLYWGPASDFWAIVDNSTRLSGMSLVRNSTEFFGNYDITMEEILVKDGWVDSPLTPADEMLRDAIGPFGSIDSVWTMFPPSLFNLVQLVKTIVLSAVIKSPSAQQAFWNACLGTNLVVMPQKWQQDMWMFMGGSPLCSDAAPSGFVAPQFLLDEACSRVGPEQLRGSRMSFAFAYLAAGIQTNNTEELVALCSTGTLNIDGCVNGLSGVHSFVNQYLSPSDRLLIANQVAITRRDLIPLNVSVMQYAQRQGEMVESALLIQPLLDDTTDGWNVFGWMFLLEWATGVREVVSFQGDNGTITLISGSSSTTSISPSSSEILVSVAPYLHLAVQYVTMVLVFVALLVLFYALLNRCNIAGKNLLEFNRVSGIVWVGRPLLILRGVVALCMLSSSSPLMVQRGELVFMEEATLSWFNSIITTGEATWLIFVLIDLLLVFTRGLTHTYAPVATQTLWLATALVQLLNPMHHTMVVDPQCEFITLDAQAVCISGSINIGSLRRLVTILIITGTSLVGCYCLARVCKKKRDVRIDGLFLPGIAQEMFQQGAWVHNDEWFVDPASAAMAGLITVRMWDTESVLDIKTWSVLQIHHFENPPSSRSNTQSSRSIARSSRRLSLVTVPTRLRTALCLGRLKLKRR